MPEIHNKDGTLSRYALECGYQELEDTGEIRTRLYSDNGLYVVRCHDHKNQTRIAWKTFLYLQDARQFYNKMRREVRDGT